ncbi:hypothetical protein MNEG_11136, partial [Monoraphidium neglectum]
GRHGAGAAGQMEEPGLEVVEGAEAKVVPKRQQEHAQIELLGTPAELLQQQEQDHKGHLVAPQQPQAQQQQQQQKQDLKQQQQKLRQQHQDQRQQQQQ